MFRNSKPFLSAEVDPATASVQIVEYSHHEIHEGDSYAVCDVQNVDTTTLYRMITTPNTTKRAHMLFDITCTGEMLISVTEGADRTGTTALSIKNRNRNSSANSGLVVHRGYTGGTTDGAIMLLSKRDGSTGVGARTVATGSERGVNERILKQNTKYIVAITTYANVHVSMCLDWYEHTSK